MGVVLFILSVILLYALSIPLIMYSIIMTPSLKALNEHFFQLAKSIDQFGNRLACDLFNDILITDKGHKYGNIDETISSVTGRNYQAGTLTRAGRIFRAFLDFAFGKNHSVNSIGERTIKQ